MTSYDPADDERDEILARPVARQRWLGRRQVELIPVTDVPKWDRTDADAALGLTAPTFRRLIGRIQPRLR
jgi:hypothetical protein